jgi:hypothetical protein
MKIADIPSSLIKNSSRKKIWISILKRQRKEKPTRHLTRNTVYREAGTR